MYLIIPIPSLFTQKFYKIQINSGKIGINWNKIGTYSEQSELSVTSLLEEGRKAT